MMKIVACIYGLSTTPEWFKSCIFNLQYCSSCTIHKLHQNDVVLQGASALHTHQKPLHKLRQNREALTSSQQSMEESGAILNQISYLKDSLDQVNREIEASIQITREIESEIVGCNELEIELVGRESELMKACYALEFELDGFLTLAADSRASVKSMEEELCRQKSKRDKVQAKMDMDREKFLLFCNDFQLKLQEDQTVKSLSSQKESLENEYELLISKDNSLRHSVSAFVEDVLEELECSISVLEMEVQSLRIENDKILKDIDDLKMTLLSTFGAASPGT